MLCCGLLGHLLEAQNRVRQNIQDLHELAGKTRSAAQVFTYVFAAPGPGTLLHCCSCCLLHCCMLAAPSRNLRLRYSEEISATAQR